jgi:hypothetical protein
LEIVRCLSALGMSAAVCHSNRMQSRIPSSGFGNRRRVMSKGSPGLAFKALDPRDLSRRAVDLSPLETRPYPLASPTEADRTAVSLSMWRMSFVTPHFNSMMICRLSGAEKPSGVCIAGKLSKASQVSLLGSGILATQSPLDTRPHTLSYCPELRDLQLRFRLANELCRIPFEFVDPAMQPPHRAMGNDYQLFYFVGGEDFLFWPVRPQAFLWGRKEVWGGGILRFNFSSYQRRRAPIVERVQFPSGCSWRRRLRVPERSRCRIPPYQPHSKQTRKPDHRSPTRFRLPGSEGRARCLSSLP